MQYDTRDGESEIENISSDDEKWFVNKNGNLVSEEQYPNGFLERKIHLRQETDISMNHLKNISTLVKCRVSRRGGTDNIILGQARKYVEPEMTILSGKG